MGIPDLMAWIRKVHPTRIQTYANRWASPELRGKRIAIDATLLTNRFHFAVQDGPLKGKGAIMGWYYMMNDMKAYGVKPMAIWDERGVRDWKAPEVSMFASEESPHSVDETQAKKRLATRGLNLMRRKHEEERGIRLKSLRKVFRKMGCLPEEEQKLVRQTWERTRFFPESEESPDDETPTPPPLLCPEPKLPATKALMDELSALVTGYRRMNKPFERAKAPAVVPDTMVEDVLASDLQSSRPETAVTVEPTLLDDSMTLLAMRLSYLLHSVSPVPEEVVDARMVPHEGLEIDKKLEQSLGEDDYTESPRQMELTRKEGEIINSFLSFPSSTRSTPSESTLPSAPSANISRLPPTGPSPGRYSIFDDIPSPPPYTTLERLGILIDEAPAVYQIYERALSVPTMRDHEDCKELLSRMGIPILEAKIPFEAEGLASALALSGLVDYVGSEDSDVVAYQAPLLKNLSTSKQPLLLIPPILPSLTALSASSFLDFLILLGTDASPRIPGVGPARAFSLITQHGSIEAILEQDEKIREKVVDMKEWLKLVGNARRIFSEMPPIPAGLEDWETRLWKRDGGEGDVDDWLAATHGVRFVDVDSVEAGWDGDRQDSYQ
ncbi:hypothetical protein P7C73_g4053, partial [Tremellales sp. Uapishka_1]